MATLQISPITPTLGAEVTGVDLAGDLVDETIVTQLRQAFLAHHVLVFRDQDLDREQHKTFGRLFGDLHVHPSKKSLGVGGDPEIFTVQATVDSTHNNGGRWHMDLSCEDVPPLGSMLLLRESPPHGGDTMFANMHAAFESLSPSMQQFLSTLTAFHDGLQDLRWYGYEPKPGQAYPATSHPVVIEHPETGRPLLFVNEAFTSHIEQLTRRESDALLALLFQHISSEPAHQCRVRWAPGTLTFWDNRCLQHFAVWDYFPHTRTGERVSICATDRPVAALR